MADETVIQARHAAEIAAVGCSATGCEWYHGVWPALRALGVVASPDRHRRFFTTALSETRPSRSPEVLVSGSADGAMVIEILHARPDARLTVVDRCATAVELAVATAGRMGTDARGHVVDLLGPVPDIGHFDAIVTHGLFGMTAEADRGTLAAAWAALLAPAGRLITTTSLGRSEASGPVGFTPEASDAFAAQVAARARDALREFGDDALGRTPAVLSAAARAWSRRAVADPVGSVDDVDRILATAGLTSTIEIGHVTGALAAEASGPWSARSGRYAHIVATRA